MTQNILLVEDETAIRDMVSAALQRAGFGTIAAGDAAEAEAAMRRARPNLVLLDWMLPGLSGIEFARRLRRRDDTRDVPIIMLTARCEEHDRLSGFDAGVDDYVVKPFSVGELVARIKAVLKRVAPMDEEQLIEIDGLQLDPVSHRVASPEGAIRVGPSEYRMLQFFMVNQERVFTRTQLLDRVWGRDVYVEERTVDVHIRRLRKALAPYGYDRFIQTVHGTGYRFSRQTA